MLPASVLRLLHIDLSTRKWHVEELDEEIYQRYLAGSGIAAKILYDELDVNVGATDPESAIIFMNGMLTGSFIPAACKMTVCARSPLTGIWCEATVGGYFPAELSRAGLGGISIHGRADRPVYLRIGDSEEVEIVDCDEIWEFDTFQSSEFLRGKTDRRA